MLPRRSSGASFFGKLNKYPSAFSHQLSARICSHESQIRPILRARRFAAPHDFSCGAFLSPRKMIEFCT